MRVKEPLYKGVGCKMKSKLEAEHEYYSRLLKDNETDLDIVILGFRDKKNNENSMEAWITPGMGSNLCRFTLGGQSIIDYDPVLLKNKDFTGTPVLYPTPNRVRDEIFLYNGTRYEQKKNGKPVSEHGLVYDEPWEYSEPCCTKESVTLTTKIEFNRDSHLFPVFPFEHILSLTFTLSREGLCIRFSINNQGSKEIPFGFGLHPYFQKLSGEQRTFVKIPARNVMDATPDLLPTGLLIPVDNTEFDILTSKKIGNLDLDHVFTGIEKGQYAIVDYEEQNLEVIMEADDIFTHIVLYSPKGESYFCLENQTCSTDAHNLYSKGYTLESGLKFVPPMGLVEGQVFYKILRG